MSAWLWKIVQEHFHVFKFYVPLQCCKVIMIIIQRRRKILNLLLKASLLLDQRFRKVIIWTHHAVYPFVFVSSGFHDKIPWGQKFKVKLLARLLSGMSVFWKLLSVIPHVAFLLCAYMYIYSYTQMQCAWLWGAGVGEFKRERKHSLVSLPFLIRTLVLWV
jgi:hypothetical protein